MIRPQSHRVFFTSDFRAPEGEREKLAQRVDERGTTAAGRLDLMLRC